jgi:hypothetical protein
MAAMTWPEIVSRAPTPAHQAFTQGIVGSGQLGGALQRSLSFSRAMAACIAARLDSVTSVAMPHTA